MPSLDDPIKVIRGAGPRAAERLLKIGVRTVGDLLRHIPRRYEDRSHIRSIASLVVGEAAVVRGRVLSAENISTPKRRLRITRVIIRDRTAAAELAFFNQPYLLRRFHEIMTRERSIVVYGTVRFTGSGLVSIEHPEWEEVGEEEEALSAGRIVPIYPISEGLTQKWMRMMVASALESHAGLIQDPLPIELRRRYNLQEAVSAYRSVHLPERMEAAVEARRRLVFEEFFVLQACLAQRRMARKNEIGAPRIGGDQHEIEQIIANALPFEPTDDQRSAISDIAADMASGRQMNRLLHGDVGSGKTAVAVVALALAARAGYQAAVMAPTEILAQQQYAVLRDWLAPLGIEVDLSVGSLSAVARAGLRQRLESGQTRVVVGTHALIEDEVRFAALGLVIIDEQHRFGVLQRQALQSKGVAPHVLVMSATPIPRTLTLTLYGDLDVTALRTMPPGRGSVKTYWKRPDETGAVYRGVADLLARGRQAYVVCPLVEESETIEAAAATARAEHIQRDLLPNYRVGLLHGQMAASDKETVMASFKRGDLDVLVSTTVIEVGIDVPNATVMVVENADRFGLAQLHQLRGRVGRGSHASYCVLIADPTTEAGIRRMQVMTETRDGFRIAEEDLRLRGPGECLGTRQSGLPEFCFGDLLRDESVLVETRKAAVELVQSDPNLTSPEHNLLRRAVDDRMRSLELATVS
ncbi:MAG: ATP-dependent DNA helicase RecG [Chthonomonadales bacterium]|nr:ATP-dependent DNA helicase RecG [Chthonomonadales bacterium]